MSSTSWVIIRGVKPFDTSRRYRKCLGGSIIEDREAEAGQRLLVGGRDERAAQLRAEGGAVVAHRLHVLVLGERPEPGVVRLGVEVHRRLGAEAVELVVRAPPAPRWRRAGRSRRGSGSSSSVGLLVQGRCADGASEGGDGRVVVDGGWVDAAHHLEAEQHADHRGAGAVGRRRTALVVGPLGDGASTLSHAAA